MKPLARPKPTENVDGYSGSGAAVGLVIKTSVSLYTKSGGIICV